MSTARMWFAVAARLGKKLVRGAWNSAADRPAIAPCRRWLASRLARAVVRRCPISVMISPPASTAATLDSERPLLEPALDLGAPVVAPERLAVDDEERRAEDAERDRGIVGGLKPGLPGRV